MSRAILGDGDTTAGPRMSPYWICQLVGWSSYGLLTAAIPTLYGGLRWVVVGRALVGAMLGIILTDRLRRDIRRRRWLGLPARHLIARIIAASLVIAVVMFLGVLPFLLIIIPDNRTGPLSAIMAGHLALVLVWCGIYLTVHYFRGTRAAESEKWRLQVAMRDTELLALRAQLNPHRPRRTAAPCASDEPRSDRHAGAGAGSHTALPRPGDAALRGAAALSD